MSEFSSKRKLRSTLLIIGLLTILGVVLLRPYLRLPWKLISERFSVFQRLQEYSGAVKGRLKHDFAQSGVSYPPSALALVALKQEKILEVYASDSNGRFHFIRSYPIFAASGHLGPKLREGDHQVPEGLYQIESLNPNSRFHLSLRVNYPNEFDRAKALAESRTNLGGDIMIHGSNVSVGCLAMGDEAAEDLFVLAALTGVENTRVIISPVDFRIRDLPAIAPNAPHWTPELYDSIKKSLSDFQK